MSGGVNFNQDVGTANVNTGDGVQNTGDGQNIAMGDGDVNVGGQTFDKTISFSALEALQSVEAGLSQVFEPLPDEADQPEPTADFPNIEFETDFEPVAIDPEEHPRALLGEAIGFFDAAEPPLEEEQASWTNRFKSMLAKGGKHAVEALKIVGPPAIAGIKALASVPFPGNVIVAALEVAVDQAQED